MPIYEGTSQIQALMAMKDTLAAVMRDPQGFVARTAKNRWRQVSVRDPLERGVARLEGLALRAQRHLITRTATDKLRSLRGQSPTTWPGALRRNWNPKRDFASAMLHAERLTRLLADELIAEVLLEQTQRHPHRRSWLERHLDRAEPRARALHDEITTTGSRVLAKLGHPPAAVTPEPASPERLLCRHFPVSSPRSAPLAALHAPRASRAVRRQALPR
jgi:hypothetical protein